MILIQWFSAAENADTEGLSMCFQARAREYLEIARRIKKERPSCLIIAGEHYASCAAQDLLCHHPEIDLVVIHEGEQTLVEIANAGTELKQRAPQIRGIVYRNGDDICFTEPRPIIGDLDSLPPSDRRGSVRLLAGVPTAPMVGSRGCFGSCDYCCVSTLHRLAPGKRFRLEMDSDTDGLCDVCESEIFGTDPKLADTDGDGVQDGDEDHDEDGIINITEMNKTVALIDAVETGDTERLKSLLEYSPYMPIIDNDGMTPLVRASYNGHGETVQVLLEAGADVNSVTNDGKSALMLAKEKGHTPIVELLMEAGAKE